MCVLRTTQLREADARLRQPVFGFNSTRPTPWQQNQQADTFTRDPSMDLPGAMSNNEPATRGEFGKRRGLHELAGIHGLGAGGHMDGFLEIYNTLRLALHRKIQVYLVT